MLDTTDITSDGAGIAEARDEVEAVSQLPLRPLLPLLLPRSEPWSLYISSRKSAKNAALFSSFGMRWLKASAARMSCMLPALAALACDAFSPPSE